MPAGKCDKSRNFRGSLQAGDEKFDALVDQKRKNQTGVVDLLYEAKYSKPESCNAVHELSQYGSKPCLAHYEAIIRVIDYFAKILDYR
jgi:hypothetical protein